jgi:hypothetical protein
MNNLLAERDRKYARMEKQMEEREAAHRAEIELLGERQRLIEKEKVDLEKQQRQRDEITPKTDFAPYSVTMVDGLVMCIGPRQCLRYAASYIHITTY